MPLLNYKSFVIVELVLLKHHLKAIWWGQRLLNKRHIDAAICLLDQLKKYGDSRTSLKSKLPLSGSCGNVNVGYDVWKLSSNWGSRDTKLKKVNGLHKQNLQTNMVPIFKTIEEFRLHFQEE